MAMMEHVVRLAVDLTVNDGQLDAFKKVAGELTETSRAETGTLGYEWFAGADGKSFRLVETYADNTAVEAHFGGPGFLEGVPKLLQVCTVNRFEIYGDPGPTVTATATGLGAVVFQYSLGLGR
jgi:quinol monooxygenase YgiN